MTKIVLYRDNPWLKPVRDFVNEVWQNQGKTNQYNCTGMDNFCIIGLTYHPIYFDAGEDEFYRLQENYVGLAKEDFINAIVIECNNLTMVNKKYE